MRKYNHFTTLLSLKLYKIFQISDVDVFSIKILDVKQLNFK